MNSTAATSPKKPLRWIRLVVVPAILISICVVLIGPFLLQEVIVRRIVKRGGLVAHDRPLTDSHPVRKVWGFENWGLNIKWVRLDRRDFTDHTTFVEVLNDVRRLNVPLLLDLQSSKDLVTDLEAASSTRVKCLYLDGQLVPIEVLQRLKKLTDLQVLEMAHCRFPNEGLSNLHDLTKLNELRLDGSSIDDAGVRQLAGLKKLTWLSLSQVEVSDSAKEELCRALPDLNLSDD